MKEVKVKANWVSITANEALEDLELFRNQIQMSREEFSRKLEISESDYEKLINKKTISGKKVDACKVNLRKLIKSKESIVNEKKKTYTCKEKRLKRGMKIIEMQIKEQGFTVSDFIRKANIQRDSYYKYLRGERTPSIELLNRMCEVLNLDISEVVKEFI